MKCLCCDENARWLRCTQFAGDHPFCDLHALTEEGFGTNDSYEYWTEVEEVEKKLYLVEVMSTFRMRYVVEAREEEHALDEVVMKEHSPDLLKEFSQEHIGTQIFSSRELSATDYMEMFDKDNDYLKSWPDAKKIEFINTIDYKDEE